MKFTIIIDLDSDAFADKRRNLKLASTLHGLAWDIAYGKSTGVVKDRKGNTVGRFGFGADIAALVEVED